MQKNHFNFVNLSSNNEFMSVKLLSFSTTKHRKKKRQKLDNKQSDFDETNKFGINAKNYTQEKMNINNSNRFYVQPKLDKNNMSKLDGDKTKWTNRTAKLNGQKNYYIDRKNTVKKKDTA
jgi:hypothetical protein